LCGEGGYELAIMADENQGAGIILERHI
jgi:hypothetical protein